MNEENHMVLPFADDGAISVEYCERHKIEYEGYCLECFLEERRREIAQEVREAMEENG